MLSVPIPSRPDWFFGDRGQTHLAGEDRLIEPQDVYLKRMSLSDEEHQAGSNSKKLIDLPSYLRERLLGDNAIKTRLHFLMQMFPTDRCESEGGF